MSLDGLVAGGRAAAERLMVDACTVTRVTGQALNETTGALTATTSTIYSGVCRVRPDGGDTQVGAGERATMLRQYVVALPADTADVTVDDIVTVTACANDAALVGATMTVIGQAKGSHLTARRLACTEVTN